MAMQPMQVKDAQLHPDTLREVLDAQEAKLEGMQHSLQVVVAVNWEDVTLSEARSALEQIKRMLAPLAKDRVIGFQFGYVPSLTVQDEILNETNQKLQKKRELNQKPGLLVPGGRKG